MISTEIIIVMAFTLMAGVIYTMWRALNDSLCISNDVYTKAIINLHNELDHDAKEWQGKFALLEQKTKDAIQSNAICCRSAMDRINSRLAILESGTKRTKKDEGSITVVMPNFKEKSCGK